MRKGGAVDETTAADDFLAAIRNGTTYAGKWTDVVEQMDPWKDLMETLIATDKKVTININPANNEIRVGF